MYALVGEESVRGCAFGQEITMRSVLWIGLAIAAFAAGATAWAITQVIAVENVATIERLKLAKIKVLRGGVL